MIKTAIIKKLPNGKYRLYSRKKDPKTHKRRNLGTFDSLSAVQKHEREIQFFKADDGEAEAKDKETEMMSDLSDVAEYLEVSGFIEDADEVYRVMNLIDGENEDYLIDQCSGIPDNQRNTENQGFIGGDAIGGSYSAFSVPLGQMAEDHLEDHEVLDILDDLPCKPPMSKRKLQNEDSVARSNGLAGNTSIDGPNAMFQGLSDSYFYRPNGSVEDNI